MTNDFQINIMPPSFDAWIPSTPQSDIAVLMSGGVDSSTTALLLRDQGWNVLGITMKLALAENCSHPAPCCGGNAAIVAHELGIPHYFLDVVDAFDKEVIDRFRKSYAAGLTPNPCADCNQFLKFGIVWDALEAQFGIKYVASGHYARVIKDTDGNSYLQCGYDRNRDQSYFIYGVPPHRLPFLVLPMGEMSDKEEVRRRASEASLQVADKPDSMELCFAGEGDYRNALGSAATESEGPIVDISGNRLGTHTGLWNYTVGQRRGLGIAASEPLYVIDIRPQENILVVGRRSAALESRVTARQLNILQPEALCRGLRFDAKIRSYNRAASCRVIEIDDDMLAVEFDEPQFAPAPGQRLVLYDKHCRIVCGGEIARSNVK